MWYRWDYYPRYPRSQPREAKGGIKSQSKRGNFGQSWWAKRWINVLERFNIGARLNRGRSYARQGQVLSIDIDKGKVQAKVQGSRPTPYQVTIEVKQLTPADWKKLTRTLAEQALFAAKLLAGEMPQDIEKVFLDNGLSLFPEKLRDLTTDCSCPDWSNPCKHVAAVYYLLGEEFDRDPFLIFKLRGLGREELLAEVGASVPADLEGKVGEAARPAAEPLPAAPADFWAAAPLPADLFGEVTSPPVHAALPRRLGSFPFWRGRERFLDTLERIYRAASQAALDALVGRDDRGSDRR